MEPTVNLPAPFDVTVHPDRAAVRVVPSGELDVASRDVLGAQLDELWASGWTDVVVDLRELVFIDSSGVHLLVRHRERASEAGARFAIVDGHPCVARTLRLCGVDDLLDRAQPEPVAR